MADNLHISSINSAKEFIRRGWAKRQGTKWLVARLHDHTQASQLESRLLDIAEKRTKCQPR